LTFDGTSAIIIYVERGKGNRNPPRKIKQNLNLTNFQISAIMITSERETRGSKFERFRKT